MKIWIVRKHALAPFQRWGHLNAYTIASTHATKSAALAEAKTRQERSAQPCTVGCVKMKEQQP